MSEEVTIINYDVSASCGLTWTCFMQFTEKINKKSNETIDIYFRLCAVNYRIKLPRNCSTVNRNRFFSLLNYSQLPSRAEIFNDIWLIILILNYIDPIINTCLTCSCVGKSPRWKAHFIILIIGQPYHWQFLRIKELSFDKDAFMLIAKSLLTTTAFI